MRAIATRDPALSRRGLLLAGLGLACGKSAIAASASAPAARIGWLTAQGASSVVPYLGEVQAGLAELGYETGRNLVIEFRYGDNSLARVPELAAELVRLPVSLIVVQGPAASIVHKLDLAIPGIYVMSADPVVAGLAESLARPGGNMTGMTFMSAEMNIKRLEFLREIIPDLGRVAVIANPDHAGEILERAALEEAAQRLGLTLAYYQTPDRNALDRAFEAMMGAPTPQAICVLADGFAVQNRHAIIAFAMRQHVPVISGWLIFAESGALCTYGPRLAASYRRLASYIDRILRGAKPAEIPIERPTTFELIVNLKIAAALGITIPPSVLARADALIE